MSRFHDGEKGRAWWQNLALPVKILIIAVGAAAAFGLAALFGFVFMWLWNWLMPHLFGIPRIGYWEGWGLVLLSSILFKGRASHGSHSAERRRKRYLREHMRSEGEGQQAEGAQQP